MVTVAESDAATDRTPRRIQCRQRGGHFEKAVENADSMWAILVVDITAWEFHLVVPIPQSTEPSTVTNQEPEDTADLRAQLVLCEMQREHAAELHRLRIRTKVAKATAAERARRTEQFNRLLALRHGLVAEVDVPVVVELPARGAYFPPRPR